MQDFKKVCVSVVAFLLMVAILSAVLIVPYMHSEALYFEDAKLRDSLAGKVDMLFCGASHAVRGFNPKVIDAQLHCNSYNLSGSLLTFAGRRALLEEELSRNPVSTVVLEISYNSLTRDESKEYAEGDTYLLPRLTPFSKRAKYFFRNVSFQDYQNVYALSLFLGATYWGRRFSGYGITNVDYTNKGFEPSTGKGLTISEEQYLSDYQSYSIETAFLEENCSVLSELIQLCKSHNADVVIAVVPLSNYLVWHADGLDAFSSSLREFCLENDCKLFDFNLLRNRYEIFSDRESFTDDSHLSAEGAVTFSLQFADVYSRSILGADNSEFFYSSYSELITHDPHYASLTGLSGKK